MPDTEKTYGTIPTARGLALVMDAVREGKKINITHLAVGDGGGAYYQPSADMTTLKNEVWRGEVNSVSVSPDSSNVLDVVAVIPATVGGFTIREMSVQTDDDVMFAICNTPDTEKVVIAAGAAGEIEVTMHIELAEAANVTIQIDPNVVTATLKNLADHDADDDAHGGRIKALEDQVAQIGGNATPIIAGTEEPTAAGPWLWIHVIKPADQHDIEPEESEVSPLRLNISPYRKGADLYVAIDDETKTVENAEKSTEESGDDPEKIKIT